MKIFVVNGYPRSGKDQFIKLCEQEIGKAYCLKLSTVDQIKKMSTQLGWDGQKDEKSRKYLCEIKKLYSDWFDYSFEYIKKQISMFAYQLNEYTTEKNGVVFIQSRQPDEIHRFSKQFNAKTIFISRNSHQEYDNYADKNVENYKYDYYIDNSKTIDDLKISIKSFLLQSGILQITQKSLKETPEYKSGRYDIVKCPICGHTTLDNHFICYRCQWEYDDSLVDDVDYSFCNHSSIKDYKKSKIKKISI